MPGRRNSSETYRYGFQGQEKDDEISGSGNSYTAMHWQYDSRLGKRWNKDPKPNPSMSVYATFANNPIWYNDFLGDTIIVDHQGYTTRVDRDDDGNLVDNLVFTLGDDGNLTALGELTKDVSADGWFANLLKANSQEADDIFNPYTFKENVKKDGKWDYKNLNSGNSKLGSDGRNEHLLGIAFSLGEDTEFSFEGEIYRSEDLNNFHFGVVGKAVGMFTETFMLKQAGNAEIGKWKERGKEVPASWKPKIYKVHNNFQYGSEIGPPYGDNPIDHEMIKKGFQYYDKNRSSLDGDSW